MHLQFLRLGTFSLGRRLEGKCDFAAYQPMISVLVCTGHHSGVLYVSRVILPSRNVVQEMQVFGAWPVSPCCLEPILLLEQGAGDDELMLRTELQNQAPVVIAIANSVST